MKWMIKTILAGEFGPMPEWMKLRSEGVAPGENIPSYIFLLENQNKRVLVDTSFSSVEDIKKYMGIYCKRDKSIKESLNACGVDKEDIDIVIITHLHWDHAGTMFEFPNARIICQKAEYEWMTGAHHWDVGYPNWFYSRVIDHKDSIELVKGDIDLLPGLSVKALGGHTPGSQMAVVETEDGMAAIPGDNIMSFDNIEKNIPIGLFYNLKACVDSLDYVRTLDARCFPSHDWRTLKG